MTWNYRVMVREGEFAIYEVFYDEGGKVQGYTETPVFPGGDTLEELKANCDQYIAALSEPVLEYRD